MRYVLMCIAALIPLLAVPAPPSAKTPPASQETGWSQRVWDRAVAACEEGIAEDDPDAPAQVRKKFCVCVATKTKHAFPRGMPNVEDERMGKRFDVLAEMCYERHVAPWRQRQEQKKPNP